MRVLLSVIALSVAATQSLLGRVELTPRPAGNPLSGLVGIALIVAALRRKSAIGGWLLYFFVQITIGFAYAVTTLASSIASANRPAHYAIYLLSSLPQILALASVVVVSIGLMWKWDWRWIVPMRAALILLIGTKLVSVAFDVSYFPQNLSVEIATLIFPSIFLAYFFMSVRVRRVFKTQDWELSAKLAAK